MSFSPPGLAAVALVTCCLGACTGSRPTPAPPQGVDSKGAIAFESDRDGVETLYVLNADGTGLRRLVSGGTYDERLTPRWSPDGTMLAFVRAVGDDLYVLRVGGGERKITNLVGGTVSWSPDSRRIAFGSFEVPFNSDSEIYVAAVDGSGKASITTGYDPAWAPDGARIAFLRTVSTAGGEQTQLWVVNPNGTGERELQANACDTTPPVWSPDANRIAFAREDYPSFVNVVNADGTGAKRVEGADGACGGPLAWAPDGTRIAFVRRDGTYLSTADGSGLVRISSKRPAAFSWSPDSKRVVEASDDSSIAGDVWVVNADGSGERRLTQGFRYGYSNTDPQWHPRGLRAAQIGGKPASRGIPTDSVVRNRVLRASSKIDLLAADGSRVAAAYATSSNCIELWDERTGALTRFHGNSCRGGAVWELALGGARLVWATYEEGNHLYEGVETATVAQPKPVSVYDNGGRDEKARDVRADGPLIVMALSPRYSSRTDGTLYRLIGSHAVRLHSKHGRPLAVEGGRIAVLSRNGSVELLAAGGRLLRTFRLGPPTVAAAALDASRLVVQKGHTIAVYDVATGRLDHTWPVARGLLEDTARGIAVYVSGTAVHLLRLSDGRDAVIHVAGKGPVHAQLEPAGLFYSYAVRDVKQPGRIAFLRFRALLARFS